MSYYKMPDGRLVSVYDYTMPIEDSNHILVRQACGDWGIKQPTESEFHTSMMATLNYTPKKKSFFSL